MPQIISRKTAISQKLKFYYTGKLCKNKHLCQKRVVNGACIKCESIAGSSKERIEFNKKYYAENTEQIKTVQKAWRNKNPEKLKAVHRQYYITHTEEVKVAGKNWRDKNHERIKYNQRKWRAANSNSVRTIWQTYYNKNFNNIKLRTNCWRINNINKVRAIQQKWKASNPGRAKHLQHTWLLKNPEKVCESTRLRNTLKERQIPRWYEKELVKQVYLKRDELNRAWGTNYVVDHIIPVNSKTVCGLHCHANLQLLDARLNSSKGNRYQTDW